ncbi:HNH endonuclease, partial [Rhodococcus sp. 06-235-1A]|uniref:HNH endonuclease signature motif containing protein n=1 Tax=Rhodococcus sp. 06-235-1A TaxID=2022508 RepID=UPI000BD17703
LDQYLASSNRPIEGGERPHLNLHIGLRDLTDLQGSADTDDITDDITDDENTRTAAESDEPPAAERGAYRDLFGDGTSVGWLPWMGPLSRHTSRQLACDCVLTAIVMDENGNPLNLARTARTVTATQRKALTARDHGCAFPGCGKPAAWTEGHHIWHWADGGPTDMNNLVLLCGFHHRLMHHSDWEVFIGTDNHPCGGTSRLRGIIPPATVDPYRQPRQSHARAGPHIA